MSAAIKLHPGQITRLLQSYQICTALELGSPNVHSAWYGELPLCMAHSASRHGACEDLRTLAAAEISYRAARGARIPHREILGNLEPSESSSPFKRVVFRAFVDWQAAASIESTHTASFGLTSGEFVRTS